MIIDLHSGKETLIKLNCYKASANIKLIFYDCGFNLIYPY